MEINHEKHTNNDHAIADKDILEPILYIILI